MSILTYKYLSQSNFSYLSAIEYDESCTIGTLREAIEKKHQFPACTLLCDGNEYSDSLLVKDFFKEKTILIFSAPFKEIFHTQDAKIIALRLSNATGPIIPETLLIRMSTQITFSTLLSILKENHITVQAIQTPLAFPWQEKNGAHWGKKLDSFLTEHDNDIDIHCAFKTPKQRKELLTAKAFTPTLYFPPNNTLQTEKSNPLSLHQHNSICLTPIHYSPPGTTTPPEKTYDVVLRMPTDLSKENSVIKNSALSTEDEVFPSGTVQVHLVENKESPARIFSATKKAEKKKNVLSDSNKKKVTQQFVENNETPRAVKIFFSEGSTQELHCPQSTTLSDIVETLLTIEALAHLAFGYFFYEGKKLSWEQGIAEFHASPKSRHGFIHLHCLVSPKQCLPHDRQDGKYEERITAHLTALEKKLAGTVWSSFPAPVDLTSASELETKKFSSKQAMLHQKALIDGKHRPLVPPAHTLFEPKFHQWPIVTDQETKMPHPKIRLEEYESPIPGAPPASPAGTWIPTTPPKLPPLPSVGLSVYKRALEHKFQNPFENGYSGSEHTDEIKMTALSKR